MSKDNRIMLFTALYITVILIVAVGYISYSTNELANEIKDIKTDLQHDIQDVNEIAISTRDNVSESMKKMKEYKTIFDEKESKIDYLYKDMLQTYNRISQTDKLIQQIGKEMTEGARNRGMDY